MEIPSVGVNVTFRGRALRGIWMTLGALLLCAVTASAQSQGRVVRGPGIILRPDGTVAAIATAGAILEVTAQSDNWFEVLVPLSLGGRGERGVIQRQLLELLAGSTPIPEGPLMADIVPSQPRPEVRYQPAPSQKTRTVRPPSPSRYFGANGAYRATSRVFRERVTFRANAEDARFDTEYVVDRDSGFNVSAGGMITPGFAFGVTVDRFSRRTPASISVSVPHPFFFDTPRVASSPVGGLRREETAVHFQFRPVWHVGARVEVAVSGGPSLFGVRQGLVGDFTYSEAYPYDSVSLSATDIVSTRNKMLLGVGFNGGGDVALFVTRHLGVGFSALFSRATVDMPVTSTRTLKVNAGGATAGLGLRVRY